MLDGVNGLDIWPKKSGISIDHQKRLIANDRDALRAAATLDRPEEEMGKITMQTLFVAGKLDEDYERIIKAASLIRNAQVFTLEGVDHVECLTKSRYVLPRMTAFLRDEAKLAIV